MGILSGFADDLMISLLIFGMIRNNYNRVIRECRKSKSGTQVLTFYGRIGPFFQKEQKLRVLLERFRLKGYSKTKRSKAMKLLSVLLVPALAVPSCLKEGTLGKDPFLPAPSCLAFSNLFHIVP